MRGNHNLYKSITTDFNFFHSRVAMPETPFEKAIRYCPYFLIVLIFFFLIYSELAGCRFNLLDPASWLDNVVDPGIKVIG